jgi:hypothetical protein
LSRDSVAPRRQDPTLHNEAPTFRPNGQSSAALFRLAKCIALAASGAIIIYADPALPLTFFQSKIEKRPGENRTSHEQRAF